MLGMQWGCCVYFADWCFFSRERSRPVPRALLVAPLPGHFAAQLRGVVAALLSEHDVYITDWIDAREVPLVAGDFGLDDYIDYLLEFLACWHRNSTSSHTGRS